MSLDDACKPAITAITGSTMSRCLPELQISRSSRAWGALESKIPQKTGLSSSEEDSTSQDQLSQAHVGQGDLNAASVHSQPLSQLHQLQQLGLSCHLQRSDATVCDALVRRVLCQELLHLCLEVLDRDQVVHRLLVVTDLLEQPLVVRLPGL